MNYIRQKVKYPKLSVLLVSFICAIFILSEQKNIPLHDTLVPLGYLGTFVAGIFYVFSFTSAPATAILLILAEHQNILVAGFIGGFGALVGDLLIFETAHIGLTTEIQTLMNEPILLKIRDFFSYELRKILKVLLAIIIIASPFPDELGVALLAGTNIMSFRFFTIFSYILNTIGIIAILGIGKLLSV